MKIIEPYVEIISKVDPAEVMRTIELAGRVCYKSEGRIKDGSAEKFIRNIIKRGHESVLEHEKITVRFVCDRGVTHEIVRHRIASFSQESTRYCKVDGGKMTVIKPCFWKEGSEQYKLWEGAMICAENLYDLLISKGATPEQARSVLPNSLKTELVMTANIREWRHFFKLRCAPAAHPQMRQVANMLLDKFIDLLPVLFGDLREKKEDPEEDDLK